MPWHSNRENTVFLEFGLKKIFSGGCYVRSKFTKVMCIRIYQFIQSGKLQRRLILAFMIRLPQRLADPGKSPDIRSYIIFKVVFRGNNGIYRILSQAKQLQKVCILPKKKYVDVNGGCWEEVRGFPDIYRISEKFITAPSCHTDQLKPHTPFDD